MDIFDQTQTETLQLLILMEKILKICVCPWHAPLWKL